MIQETTKKKDMGRKDFDAARTQAYSLYGIGKDWRAVYQSLVEMGFGAHDSKKIAKEVNQKIHSKK